MCFQLGNAHIEFIKTMSEINQQILGQFYFVILHKALDSMIWLLIMKIQLSTSNLFSFQVFSQIGQENQKPKKHPKAPTSHQAEATARPGEAHMLDCCQKPVNKLK